MASDVAYEARVLTAHLPMRTVTFIYPESGIPFAGGIFRIERVRTTTAEDEANYPSPPDEVCPCCGRPEQ
jgi:hypothetical protein